MDEIRIRDSVRGRRAVVAVLLGWSLLEAGQTFLLGYALAHAMDQGFLRGRQGTGLWWLALAAAAVPVGAYGTARVFGAVADLVEPMRDRLVRRVVGRGLHDAVRGGGRPADSAVVSRLTHQVEIARDSLGGIVMVLRSFVFTAAGALAGMIALAPVLLLVVLPPLAAGIALFALALRPLAGRQRRYLAADEAVAEECGTLAGGLRDITACGAQEPMAERAGTRVDAALRAARALALWGVLRTAALAVGGQLPVVLLLVTAPWLLSSHRITPGALLGAFAYLTQSLQPALQNLIHTLGIAGTRLGVVLHRISGPPEDAPAAHALRVPTPERRPAAAGVPAAPALRDAAPGAKAPVPGGVAPARGDAARAASASVPGEVAPAAGVPVLEQRPAATGVSVPEGVAPAARASALQQQTATKKAPEAGGMPLPPRAPAPEGEAAAAGAPVAGGVAPAHGVAAPAAKASVSGRVAPAAKAPAPGGAADAAWRPAAGVVLDLRGVTFAYGPAAEPVLRGLDLAVVAGEHLAVVGPSGTGKSTLAGLLAGLLVPSGGEVRRAGPVALVPQEAYVFRGTVAENVGYLREHTTPALVTAAAAAVGAAVLVDALGGPDAQVDPAALSTGERQLLALARTYLAPAGVVVLDEATCHLDPAAEAFAERAFAERPATTLVVIAHRISSARRADRTLVLDGADTACGPHADLLGDSPLYSDLAAAWAAP